MNSISPPPPLIVSACGSVIIQYMLTKMAPPVDHSNVVRNQLHDYERQNN